MPLSSFAAPTAEQRREIEALRAPYAKAGELYRQGKYEECAATIGEIQEKVEALAADGDEEMLKLLAPIHKSLQGLQSHPEFDLRGIRLPPLADLPKAAAPAPPSAPGEISFVRQVAPMLVGKCGRCHIQQSRGEFSMATFDSLMRGSSAGIVVRPGDGDASRIVEVIESGDMPRGGGRVSSEELTALKNWIKQGARFDGASRAAPLAAAAAAPAMETPRLEVAKPTGNESVQFSRDLAAVISEKCANCHGRGQRPAGRLNLTTFRGLLDGGDSGAAIVPGKPAESLLIKKLRGTADGERMPRGQPPLPEETIAAFEKWIAEGARFDADPAQDVGQVAALYRAANASHDELSADRAALAERNWRLALTGVESNVSQTENFHLRGNVGENTLAEIGQRAEQMAPKIGGMFGAPQGQPLVKGRMTLYVLGARYDYGEFGRMVEKRDIPSTWRGHWGYTIVDAYGAVVAPTARDSYSLDTLIGQQLAGVYVASVGKSPRWFAEGAARAAAVRLDGADGRVLAWEQQIPEILAKMQSPDDFLTGKLSAEEADVASYSFVNFLMSDPRRFQALLNGLRQGGDFNAAFEKAYGGSPSQVAPRWIAKAASKRPPRRIGG